MNTLAKELVSPPPIRILRAEKTDAPALDTFVRTSPRATMYHLSAWRDLVSNLFGHQTYCLYARGDDGSVRGMLPLVRLRSLLFGDYMVSMPYVNYGGAAGFDPQTEQALMEGAVDLAREIGTSRVEFRDDVERSWPFGVRTDKVAMIRPLPATTEVLWKEIGSKVRAQVKRPLRENARIIRGHGELLDDFYTVFARNMRDLGTPVYGREFFSAILGYFAEAASITVVRLGNVPVAAALLLRDGARMEVPWASSLREANGIGTNMLLYWSLLEHAVEGGCSRFDFGRSTRDGGTYRFKKQWGAEEHPLYWHYWVAPGRRPPDLRTDNPKYALAIRLWQRLPVGVTRMLGPRLVKNLP